MNRKRERLAKQVVKAGIRASIREGHALTEAELRDIKVQVLPNPLRIAFGGIGVVLAAFSYYFLTHGFDGYGVLTAVIAVFFILFGIFGVRRTLSKVLDTMDYVDAASLVGSAVKGIGSALESVFDSV